MIPPPYLHTLFFACRNNKGQLGIGSESDVCQCTPSPIPAFQAKKFFVSDVGCGDDHTTAIVKITKQDKTENSFVYAWGDDTHLQLGSCDSRTRSTPNEVTSPLSRCYFAKIHAIIENLATHTLYVLSGALGDKVLGSAIERSGPQ